MMWLPRGLGSLQARRVKLQCTIHWNRHVCIRFQWYCGSEGTELGLIGAEVVGESVALLGAEAAVIGLSAFAAADFWNPLGWVAAGLAA
jgi:hypothetical protein